MNVISKTLRARINQGSHHAALRYEAQLRDKWTKALTDAMQGKAAHTQLQALLTGFEVSELHRSPLGDLKVNAER